MTPRNTTLGFAAYPPTMKEWETLTAEECLDRLGILIQDLPEPQRTDAMFGLKLVGIHLYEALSELEDIEAAKES